MRRLRKRNRRTQGEQRRSATSNDQAASNSRASAPSIRLCEIDSNRTPNQDEPASGAREARPGRIGPAACWHRSKAPPAAGPAIPRAQRYIDRFGRIHTGAVFDVWSEVAVKAMGLKPLHEDQGDGTNGQRGSARGR